MALRHRDLPWWLRDLPWWLRDKESAYSATDTGDLGSIPGSGRSSVGRTGNPLATHSSILA